MPWPCSTARRTSRCKSWTAADFAESFELQQTTEKALLREGLLHHWGDWLTRHFLSPEDAPGPVVHGMGAETSYLSIARRRFFDNLAVSCQEMTFVLWARCPSSLRDLGKRKITNSTEAKTDRFSIAWRRFSATKNCLRQEMTFVLWGSARNDFRAMGVGKKWPLCHGRPTMKSCQLRANDLPSHAQEVQLCVFAQPCTTRSWKLSSRTPHPSSLSTAA